MTDPFFGKQPDIVVHGPPPGPPLTGAAGERAAELARELHAMIDAEKGIDMEHRAAFLGPATKDRTRAIGAELWELGGDTAMGDVYDTVFHRDRVYARMLEMAWDGIGDWLG